MRSTSFFPLTVTLLLSVLLLTTVIHQQVVASSVEEKPVMTREQLAQRLALKDEDIDKMNLKELRRQLARRNTNCDDCIEKDHFRQKLKEAVQENIKRFTSAESGDDDSAVLKNLNLANENVLRDEIESQDKNEKEWSEKQSGVKKKQQQQQEAAKKEKLKQSDLPPGVDLSALKEQYLKKKKQNEEMKEALRRAGHDTTGIKFGQDDDAMARLFGDL